jgi:hypothetical protein
MDQSRLSSLRVPISVELSPWTNLSGVSSVDQSRCSCLRDTISVELSRGPISVELSPWTNLGGVV